MAVDNLATCICIKMRAVAWPGGRHGSLVTLVDSGSGAQSKANCKASKAKCSRRQFAVCWVGEGVLYKSVEARPRREEAEFRCRARSRPHEDVSGRLRRDRNRGPDVTGVEKKDTLI